MPTEMISAFFLTPIAKTIFHVKELLAVSPLSPPASRLSLAINAPTAP